MTGIRTNGLVSIGSALFVMMGALIPGGDSMGRVASYVVSGIGFLGGGVILKEGSNIRGLNTAATLWCTAAVGSLAGVGQLDLAAFGAFAIVFVNLVLRPVSKHFRQQAPSTEQVEILYRFRCACRLSEEAHVRALLLEIVGRSPLGLVALQSRNDEASRRVEVKAFLKAIGRKDEHLEHVVSRLSLEPGILTIAWEVAASVDMDEEVPLVSDKLVEAELAT